MQHEWQYKENNSLDYNSAFNLALNVFRNWSTK